jgi:Transcriptional regulator, AbiEi antitoxin, Type IV TA system
MKFRSPTEQAIIEKLLESLRELPYARADLMDGHRVLHDPREKVDAEIDFQIGHDRFKLLVEVKKAVFPRDTREALWQLQDYVRSVGGGNHVVPVLAAESISPGSKDLLKREEVGYFDTGGSLFLPAPGAYVYVDKPAPRSFAKSVNAVFKGRRAQVLQVLVHNRQRWFSVKAVADAARVSPATASETLSALERFEWLASRGQGPAKERQLVEPKALLDEWKKQVIASRKPEIRRFFVPNAANHDTFADRMDSAFKSVGTEYVLTQESAAQRYAPFLSSVSRVSCRIASSRNIPDVLGILGAREVSEGANLAMIETFSEEGPFMFKERHGPAWLANPVQVYLDLQLAGGRAQEAAEHLRKERIGF